MVRERKRSPQLDWWAIHYNSIVFQTRRLENCAICWAVISVERLGPVKGATAVTSNHGIRLRSASIGSVRSPSSANARAMATEVTDLPSAVPLKSLISFWRRFLLSCARTAIAAGWS